MPPTGDSTEMDVSLAVVHTRLDGYDRELQRVSQRLDKYSSGELEKLKASSELATRFEQLQLLVGYLDDLLVRGNANNPSMKSVVEALSNDVAEVKEGVKEVRTTLTELKKELEKKAQAEATIHAAELSHRSQNWKTTAILIASLVGSITALLVAIWT